jgi:hypothetical protein
VRLPVHDRWLIFHLLREAKRAHRFDWHGCYLLRTEASFARERLRRKHS